MRIIPPSIGHVKAHQATGVMRLVLDSLHANYATVTGALTILQTQDGAFNGNQKLIVAVKTDDRTGSLASIHRSNLGVGVFLDEFVDETDWQLRGLDFVGSSGRTSIYIRPRRKQASVGAAFSTQTYNTGDGHTFGNAIAGLPCIAPSGEITFSVNPSNGQTIGLNGVTWTFVTSGATGNQTNIQVDLATTLGQLSSDLNASADTDIDDAFYKNTSTKLRIDGKTYGNSTFALSAGTAASSVSAATLTLRDGNSAVGALDNGTTTFWICDDHIEDVYWNPSSGAYQDAARSAISILSGTDNNNRVHFRFDYPGRPGRFWGGKVINRATTAQGDGTYTVSMHNSSSTVMLLDPGWKGINGEGLELTKVTTLAACQATENTYYSSTYGAFNTLYIHLEGGADPQHRVMQADQGYMWWPGEQFRNYISIYDEFQINCAQGHCSRPPPGNISWLAGRRGGGYRKFAASGAHLFEATRVDDNLTGNVDNILIEDMTMIRGTAGIYLVRNGESKRFTNVTIRRTKVSDCGGAIAEEADSDGHGMGFFGGVTNLTVEDCILDNCGGHFNHYIPTGDANGTGMTVTNLTIQGGHPPFWPSAQYTSDSANVAFFCAQDNATVSDRSGAVITNLVIKADADVRMAFKNHWDDLVTVNNLTIEEGAYSVAGINSIRTYNDAGTLRCSCTKLRGHDISAGSGTTWKWVSIVTTASFGTDQLVIDYDNGTYREKTAGDDDGTRFSVTPIGNDTFAQWQAETGTDCTFDPSSTLVEV